MKLSKIMLALAATATAAGAAAAPTPAQVVRTSGASALKANFARALAALCPGGNMREWISGSNVSTYVCFAGGQTGLTSGAAGTYASAPAASFVNFTGTSYAEVRLNVSGGSFTALQTAAGGSDLYLNPALGGASVAGGVANAGTTGGQTETSAAGIGGCSDVDVTGFSDDVRNSIPGLNAVLPTLTNTPSGVAQAFGVAVSGPLYTAMFNAQISAGSPTADKPIPSTCVVGNTADPTCVPTISRADVAALINNSNFNTVQATGASYFGAPAGSQLRYIRRVDTSGTQASANNYFLGLPSMDNPLAIVADPSNRLNATAAGICNTNDIVGPAAVNNEVDAAFVALGQVDLCDQAVNGVFRVLAAPGTGDVRNELNKAVIQGGATNYAIGILSAENAAQATYQNLANLATPTAWKFIKVQDTPLVANATPVGTNQGNETLINGRYDFYYEAVCYTKNTAANNSFINAVVGGLQNLPLANFRGLARPFLDMQYTRNNLTGTPSSRQ